MSIIYFIIVILPSLYSSICKYSTVIYTSNTAFLSIAVIPLIITFNFLCELIVTPDKPTSLLRLKSKATITPPVDNPKKVSSVNDGKFLDKLNE